MRLSNGTEQKAGPGRGLGWNFQCQLPNPFAHFLISLSRRVLTTGLLQLATGLIFSICGFSGLQGCKERTEAASGKSAENEGDPPRAPAAAAAAPPLPRRQALLRIREPPFRPPLPLPPGQPHPPAPPPPRAPRTRPAGLLPPPSPPFPPRTRPPADLQ